MRGRGTIVSSLMRRRREGGGFIVLWGVRVALPGKESEE